MTIKDLFIRLFDTKTATLLAGGAAGFSLLAAFVAEYGFGLQPCFLCIVQRWPAGISGLIAVVAAFTWHKLPRPSLPLIAIGLLQFANASIAFFHTGVERRWWHGTDACHMPNIDPNDFEAIRKLVTSNFVPCDQLSWTFMGLSMANYNVLFCLGLAVYAALALSRDNWLHRI